MPKLKSVHMSRVGHPSARLDELSIYFTAKGDPNGRPEESTILALRNGGGKTSLLHLLFSTFVPDKREFTGRNIDGGERTFDQYFQPQDLALIVTEWDLGENLPHRIVGQCVMKNTASETSPQQCFFSFLVNDDPEDFQLTDLPLRQFKNENNAGNASSFNAFKQNMRMSFALKPHQQLMITETQKDWLKALRSWGYEPDLFRLLIALNKSEGGSKEMAKDFFGTTEKMIGLIAMLSTSEHDRKKGIGVGNIHDLISQYREDLNHLPEKEEEQRMWERLSGALVELIEPGKELLAQQKAKDEAHSELIAVGQRVMATPAVLETQKTSIENEIHLLGDLHRTKKGEITVVEKKQRWVEKEILGLSLTAANEAKEAAETKLTNSRYQFRGLSAHNLSVQLEKLEKERDGLNAAIHEATEPTRDIENNLHALGSQIKTLLSEKISVETLRQEKAISESDRAQSQINLIRGEEKESTIEFGRIEQDLKNLEKWFDDAKKEAPELNGQTAAEALELKKAQKSSLEGRDNFLAGEIDRLTQERDQLLNARSEAIACVSQAKEKVAEHDKVLSGVQEAAQEISTNDILCLLAEDEIIDPYSPSLPSLLAARKTRLGNEKFNLTVEQRRSREALNFLEGEYKLMAPPEDVWHVCEALNKEEINAYPYVKYLCEINIEPEKIRNLLASDPARYGGVCVTKKDDLVQAKDIASKLPGIRGPVQIYPLDKHLSESLSPSVSNSVISLPSSDATFSRNAADAEQRKLVTEIQGRDDDLGKIDLRLEEIETATDTLKVFLAKYPDGTESDLLLEKQKLEEKVQELTVKSEGAQEAFANNEALLSEHIQQRNQVQGDLTECQKICLELDGYVKRFESHFPEKNAEKKRLEGRRELVNKFLSDAIKRIEGQEKIKGLAEDKKQIAENNLKILAERKLKISYAEPSRGEIPEDVSQDSLESLQSLYDSARQIFEEKNRGIEGLIAKRDSLHEKIAEKGTERSKLVGPVPESVIEEILKDHGMEEIPAKQLEVAEEEVETDNEAFILANKAAQDAKVDLNQFAFGPAEIQATEDCDELTNISDFERKKASLAEELDTKKNQRKELGEKIHSLETSIGWVDKDLTYLKKTVSAVKAKIGPCEETPGITGYDGYDEVTQKWADAEHRYAAASSSEQKSSAAVDKKKHAVMNIANDERYSGISTILRQRIVSQFETLHLDALDFAQEAGEAFKSVSYTVSKTKDQLKEIVSFLMDDIRTVKSNLDALDRISEIPETDTAWAKWSGRKFFKVNIEKKKIEGGHCQTKVEEYVRKLVHSTDRGFPTNAQDIIEGVAKFALKDIVDIKTMKPDHFMSTKPETLEEAARWSGGEGFTYAALSLMVFNQLVCHINATSNLAGGIIVVDNPIGICSHVDFLKLQQIMANILDNQLIYPTAVKDYDALSLFRNVVTLSNNNVDGKTGFKHVRVEKNHKSSNGLDTAHLTFTPEVIDVLNPTI